MHVCFLSKLVANDERSNLPFPVWKIAITVSGGGGGPCGQHPVSSFVLAVVTAPVTAVDGSFTQTNWGGLELIFFLNSYTLAHTLI